MFYPSPPGPGPEGANWIPGPLEYPDIDYDAIFSQVRRLVKSVIGKERSGLGLAIGEFDPRIAAFWEVGGNYLVLNGALLRKLGETVKDRGELRDYVLVVLMHEYVHSLGFTDELATRKITEQIIRETMGDRSRAARISSQDLWSVYPQLMEATPVHGAPLVIVPRFSTEDLGYIA